MTDVEKKVFEIHINTCGQCSLKDIVPYSVSARDRINVQKKYAESFNKAVEEIEADILSVAAASPVGTIISDRLPLHVQNIHLPDEVSGENHEDSKDYSNTEDTLEKAASDEVQNLTECSQVMRKRSLVLSLVRIDDEFPHLREITQLHKKIRSREYLHQLLNSAPFCDFETGCNLENNSKHPITCKAQYSKQRCDVKKEKLKSRIKQEVECKHRIKIENGAFSVKKENTKSMIKIQNIKREPSDSFDFRHKDGYLNFNYKNTYIKREPMETSLVTEELETTTNGQIVNSSNKNFLSKPKTAVASPESTVATPKSTVTTLKSTVATSKSTVASLVNRDGNKVENKSNMESSASPSTTNQDGGMKLPDSSRLFIIDKVFSINKATFQLKMKPCTNLIGFSVKGLEDSVIVKDVENSGGQDANEGEECRLLDKISLEYHNSGIPMEEDVNSISKQSHEDVKKRGQTIQSPVIGSLHSPSRGRHGGPASSVDKSDKCMLKISAQPEKRWSLPVASMGTNLLTKELGTREGGEFAEEQVALTAAATSDTVSAETTSGCSATRTQTMDVDRVTYQDRLENTVQWLINSEIHRCDNCGLIFNCRFSLAVHHAQCVPKPKQASPKTPIKMYKCSRCSMSVDNREVFNFHEMMCKTSRFSQERYSMNKRVFFTCSICYKHVGSVDEMVKHLNRLHGSRVRSKSNYTTVSDN